LQLYKSFQNIFLENQQDLLLEEPIVKLVPANLFKRFANYLIDVFTFSFVLTILLVMLSTVSPQARTLINILTKKPETISLVNQLLMSLVFGLYISAMESLLKGKTIGKYITGTRAVNENGIPVDTQTAFTRGLIRMIPFEQLSLLVAMLLQTPLRAWHDKWSFSFVVDESKSVLPKEK
jgi:uncharacterized RDD family membrane protein YckC